MASIKKLRKMVSKGKHGRLTSGANLGKQYDATELIRLERKVDSVGQSVRSSKGIMGRIGKGVISTLTGGRFGRWVGKVTMKGGAKLLRKVGLGKAADWIKVLAARNGLLSKIIKASIGMAVLNKLRQLFSKKKSGDPDDQGNVKPTPKDPFENKLEKDILKKDNLERFNEIKSENQSRELAAQSSILKVEADKAKKAQESALGKKVDPADPAQVQAKADELAKANAQILDVQGKKLDAVNQKLDAQSESIKATREQTAKLHQILSERLKAIYTNLKEKLTDKVDEKKQTFFGWLKSAIGRIFTTVMGLGSMLVTILAGLAVPKLKEGWDWVKDKVGGLFGGKKDSGSDAGKSESVETNLGEAASKDPGAADVDTSAVEVADDEGGVGLGTMTAMAGVPMLMGIPARKAEDSDEGTDATVDTKPDEKGDKPESKPDEKGKKSKKTKSKKAKPKKKGWLSRAWDGAKNLGKKAWSGVKKVGKTIAKGAGTAWKAVKTTAKKAWNAVIKKALGSKIGQKLAKISLKGIGKAAGKAAGKSLLKKIPILGILAGVGFAISRALKKDWVGAAGELISGIASCIPGIGTAASAVIDAGLMAKDIMSEEDDGTRVEIDDDGKLKNVNIIDDKDDAKPQTTSTALPKAVQDQYAKATSTSTAAPIKVTPTTTTPAVASVSAVPNPSRAMSADPSVVAATNGNALTKKDLDDLQANMKRSTDQIFMMQELIMGNQFVDNTKAFKINGKDNQLNVG